MAHRVPGLRTDIKCIRYSSKAEATAQQSADLQGALAEGISVRGFSESLCLYICPTRCWTARGSSLRQVHLRQNRTPQETVGIGERLRDLKVVVTFADEELHGFACCLQCGSEVA